MLGSDRFSGIVILCFYGSHLSLIFSFLTAWCLVLADSHCSRILEPRWFSTVAGFLVLQVLGSYKLLVFACFRFSLVSGLDLLLVKGLTSWVYSAFDFIEHEKSLRVFQLWVHEVQNEYRLVFQGYVCQAFVSGGS